MKRCLFFFPLFCDTEMLKFKEYYSHRVHQIIGDIILDENSIFNIKIIKKSIPDDKISNFMMIIILIMFLITNIFFFRLINNPITGEQLLSGLPKNFLFILKDYIKEFIPFVDKFITFFQTAELCTVVISLCELFLLLWYYIMKEKTKSFVLWIENEHVVTSTTSSQHSEEYGTNPALDGFVKILNNNIFSTLLFVCIIITNLIPILINILIICGAFCSKIFFSDKQEFSEYIKPIILLIFCIWKFILEIRMYKWLKRMITPISFLTELENNFCNFKNNEITMEEFHKIVSDIIARYTTNL